MFMVATQGIDSRHWTMLCVCDRCVVNCEIVTLTFEPTLIKCAVKLTLFVQFRCKLV